MNSKKIIATLGPSSLKKEIVQKMDILGVDIFRLNLSHIDLNEFEKTLKMVTSWTKKIVCPDSEGAQLRTGNINGEKLNLIKGSTIKIVGSSEKERGVSIQLNLKKPEKLLAEFGIDITKSRFWQDGFDYIQDKVKELSSL